MAGGSPKPATPRLENGFLFPWTTLNADPQIDRSGIAAHGVEAKIVIRLISWINRQKDTDPRTRKTNPIIHARAECVSTAITANVKLE